MKNLEKKSILLPHIPFLSSKPCLCSRCNYHPNITYLLMSMAVHCFVLGNNKWFESVKNTRNQIWSILRTYQTTLQTMECVMESIFSWRMQMRKHRDRAIKSLDSPSHLQHMAGNWTRIKWCLSLVESDFWPLRQWSHKLSWGLIEKPLQHFHKSFCHCRSVTILS